MSLQNLSAETGSKIPITEDLYLKEIAENVWIHVSTEYVPPWGNVSANGLVLLAGNDVILIDTPWNGRQTGELAGWFESNRRARIAAVIVCHYHEDNLGGLSWIHDREIVSYSIERTGRICRERGLPVPQISLADDETLFFSGEPVRVFFPGEGHTVDSVCVYLPTQRILFGGCSVKSLNSRTLGNTQEANLEEWPASLRKMREEFPEAAKVVPGHGEEGSLQLIDHTIELLKDREE